MSLSVGLLFIGVRYLRSAFGAAMQRNVRLALACAPQMTAFFSLWIARALDLLSARAFLPRRASISI